MFGNIIGIEGNVVLISLKIDINKIHNLINSHVIMEDDDVKLIGEIYDIKDNIAYVNLIGELNGNDFIYGVIKKPAFKSTIKIVSKEKIPMIISNNYDIENKYLYIGKSAVYEDVSVKVGIDEFFSNHFSIFGSTGSGKSCGVARILQNLFMKENYIPYRSSIFIFDAYGEYRSAFKETKELPNINFKHYTTDINSTSELIRVPLWLLGVDDVALILGATSHSQLPIIEKALCYVNIFARDEKDVIRYKNDVIARALLDILSSGRPSNQIRDQILSVLTHFNTKDLNLETPVHQPGYTRPLKQCLLIDASGKLREMELLTTFIESFEQDNVILSLPDGSFKYTLDDLKSAFDFALISEGILKSDKIFDDCNILKVRLHSLVNSSNKEYFDYPEYISRDQYIKKLLTASNGQKAQIINFNINYIDDRLAKNLVKIYSKLLFDYAKGLKKKATLPINIVLEEAHRYVQNDSDIFLLGYNIFERISKEGRKYGVMLGLISQRPTELSETCLSQCSNFLIFKMAHPKDVNYIENVVPNITSDIVKRLSILQPGMCIGFGNGFKVPIVIKLDMPSPAPDSSNCNISNIWFVKKKS